MLRLLLALVCGLAIAATLLVMRQQRLELQHQCNAVHDEMLAAQKQLWQQQLQIAAVVSPCALRTVLASHDQRLVAGDQSDSRDAEIEGLEDWSVLRR